MRKYLPRRYYSEADKALMWDRWQKGESLHTIGRLFERSHTSVRRILAETGGIRPAQRRRSRLALTRKIVDKNNNCLVKRSDLKTAQLLR